MPLFRFFQDHKFLSAFTIAFVIFCLFNWFLPQKPHWIKSKELPKDGEVWYLGELVSANAGTQGCTIIVPTSDCLVTVIAKDETGLEVLTIRRYHKQPYCEDEDFSKPLPKPGPIVRRQCLSLHGLLGENANIEGVLLLLMKRMRSEGA